jgi:hypothetical protein
VNTENEIGMPPWFNATLGKIGQDWVQKNLFAAYLGPLSMALLQFFSFPHFDRLVKAHGSFDASTPEKGAARLIATIIQHQIWWSQDLNGPIVQKSLARVRGLHQKAAYRARFVYTTDIREPIKGIEEQKRKNAESRMWRAFAKDVEPLKKEYAEPIRVAMLRNGKSDEIPFNMYDMVQVSSMILCPSLMIAEKFGVRGTEEEMLAWNHMWAGITYGLGVDDAFNVALNHDLEGVRQYCREHFASDVIPNFINMDDETKLALDGTLESTMLIFPYINTKAGWLYFFFDVFNLPGPNLKRVTGIVGRGFNGALDPVLRPLLGNRFGTRVANFYMMTMYRMATRKYLGVDLGNMEEVAEKGFYTGLEKKLNK